VASPRDGRFSPDSQIELEKPKPVISPITLIAAFLIFSFALFQGLGTKNGRDFFIYRLGAELAIRGENPYDIERVRNHVAAGYPEEDENTKEFINNCGYFLPPMALVIFLPLAAISAVSAKICWAVAIGVAGGFVSRLPGVLRSKDSIPLPVLPRSVVPFLLVLNPLTLAVVLVGQVSLLSLGCVAAGLWCLDRGRPYVTAILWVVPFMKPHLALPLIPLLWFLAGWRPTAVLVVLLLALNLGGATLAGGSPLFLRDYLAFLSDAHKTVAFNRVETNLRITSWNRLLLTVGGPLIELSAVTTVAGYLVWLGLIIGRTALSRTRPSASWTVAVAAVGAVLCSQVLVYELVILALMVPWVRDLFANGYRLRGWIAVVLLAVPLIPGIPFPPSLGVMLLAVLVLVGPVDITYPRLPQSGP
jgi:hypothetical protein